MVSIYYDEEFLGTLLTFNPEIFSNFSKIVKIVLNELIVWSADWLIFNSFSPILIPLISGLFIIYIRSLQLLWRDKGL